MVRYKTIGIDPGTNIMGFSILEKNDGKIKVEQFGIIKISNLYSTEKLLHVYNEVSKLVDKYKPNTLAVETQFLGNNVQSLLKLGRVQGIVILVGLQYKLSVKEYSPRTIKKMITGNGSSTKEQVAFMVSSLLGIDVEDCKYDSTDALSIALCDMMEHD